MRVEGSFTYEKSRKEYDGSMNAEENG